MSKNEHTNQLITETSPYLLQHAHNPVNWHGWNPETLEKAKRKNKLILVSVGYSACHWCHVMEHESFENEEVAKVMNENFICIKVDREERPDVDQIYMDAVHLIGGRGGWPLNCFALPDGRPFWGGTYFPKEQWIEILDHIVHLFNYQKERLMQQAADITEGLNRSEFHDINKQEKAINREMFDDIVDRFSRHFDDKNGGSIGVPKFPMPNNYLFLLRYYTRTKKPEILEQIELTLQKMARGGIYDQVGGGFARYAVDNRWHTPHFEKMLYDNAQLVSLYSEAFRLTKNEFYKKVVLESLEFIGQEMTSPACAFYSSLDADSDSEEGRFYVWERQEIEDIAGLDKDIVIDYYGIDGEAYWEDGKNILVKALPVKDLSEKYNKPENEIAEILAKNKVRLLEKRSERVRPGLDDKVLTSWNALMLKGYVDAYLATGINDYLNTAKSNAAFILQNLKKEDGGLFHNYKNEKATINGFLEDYAFVIEAYIMLYQASFELIWLTEAKNLLDYAIKHFYDPPAGLFYFTSKESNDLITRKFEISDNVMPASNSSMANSLFLLSHYFENSDYQDMAEKMLLRVKEKMKLYPSAFTNWGILSLNLFYPFYTIAICGSNFEELSMEMNELYLPNILLACSGDEDILPILKNRFVKNKTLIYVCSERDCKPPVKNVIEAIGLINS
jgi:uncharacterized protein YyaL (SSP411 family)